MTMNGGARQTAAAGVRELTSAAAIAIMAAAAPASAQPATPRVVIRAYDGFGVTGEEIRVARAEVFHILQRAGVDMIWRDCRESGGDRCRDELASDELIVRLTRAPAFHAGGASDATGRGPRDVALGYSIVSATPGASRFATVFPDRVRLLAARADVPAGVPLGYAIAHEVGHLLTVTSGHSSKGLMRAHWSAKDLRRRDAADWELLPEQQAALRSALVTPSLLASLAAAAAPVALDWPVDH